MLKMPRTVAGTQWVFTIHAIIPHMVYSLLFLFFIINHSAMSISVQIFSLSIWTLLYRIVDFILKRVVQVDLLGMHSSICNPASSPISPLPHFIR